MIVVDKYIDEPSVANFISTFVRTYKGHGGKVLNSKPPIKHCQMARTNTTADEVRRAYDEREGKGRGTKKEDHKKKTKKKKKTEDTRFFGSRLITLPPMRVSHDRISNLALILPRSQPSLSTPSPDRYASSARPSPGLSDSS